MVPKLASPIRQAVAGDRRLAQAFDWVEVDEAAWTELHRLGALDELQHFADGLVGRWEEAWFDKPALLEVTCLRELSRLPVLRHALLWDVALLARTADARGAVVIFAIF